MSLPLQEHSQSCRVMRTKRLWIGLTLNSIKLIPGVRAVVLVHIHQVGASCGFSVPKYEFQEFRPTLNDFFEKRQASEDAGKKEDGIERYWAYKNALSMDNLPGLKRGYETAQKDAVKPIQKMVGPLAKKPIIPSKKLGTTISEMTGMEGSQLVLLVMLVLLGGLAALSFLAVEMGWLDGFATEGMRRTPNGVEFMVGKAAPAKPSHSAGTAGWTRREL